MTELEDIKKKIDRYKKMYYELIDCDRCDEDCLCDYHKIMC